MSQYAPPAPATVYKSGATYTLIQQLNNGVCYRRDDQPNMIGSQYLVFQLINGTIWPTEVNMSSYRNKRRALRRLKFFGQPSVQFTP